MASSAYAAASDITGTSGYLRDASATPNATILNILCAAASRLIDEMCGQPFYDDGAYIRYFNGAGGAKIDTNFPFFFSSGTIGAANKGVTTLTYTASVFAPRPPVANEAMVIDVGSNREVLTPSVVTGTNPYTLTVPATGFAHAAASPVTTCQINIAYFENQPIAQWILQLDGDGWTPPTNWYTYPNVIRRVGAANQGTADNTSVKPWYGIDLPMIPITNTLWLPTTMIGKATIGITAHWGWPVVPDLIKDLTCKLAVRLWRKRQAGEGDIGGAADLGGMGNLRELFDASDEAVLLASGLKLTYI